MRWTTAVALTIITAQAQAATCRVASKASEKAAFGTAMGAWAAGGGIFAASVLIEPAQGDGSYIPPIDQGVPTTFQKGPAVASDILLYTGLATGVAGMISHSAACGRQGATGFAWANPFIEGMSTSLMTFGITNLTKVTTGRPRPYTRSGTFLGTDDYSSFFSGHASLTAWGVGYGLSEMLRMADLPFWSRALIGVGAGFGGGMATGSQRVAAGKHYWSDVLVGSGVGAVLGIVPSLLDPAWNDLAQRQISVQANANLQGVSLAVSGRW